MVRQSKKKKKHVSHAKLLIKLAKARRQVRALRHQNELRKTLVQAFSEASKEAKHNTTEVTTTPDPEPEAVGMLTISSLLMVILSDNVAEAPPPPPLTSFTFFTKLPAELRVKIWEAALPGRRVFEPNAYDFYDSQQNLQTPTVFLYKRFPPPNIRGACKEAWDVTERHGSFCFGSQGGSRSGCWFNHRRDVLFIHTNEIEYSLRTPGNFYNYINGFIRPAQPRHIALHWRHLEMHYEAILDLLLIHGTVKVIWAVHEQVHPRDHVVQFEDFRRLTDLDEVRYDRVHRIGPSFTAWMQIKYQIITLMSEFALQNYQRAPNFRLEGMTIAPHVMDQEGRRRLGIRQPRLEESDEESDEE